VPDATRVFGDHVTRASAIAGTSIGTDNSRLAEIATRDIVSDLGLLRAVALIGDQSCQCRTAVRSDRAYGSRAVDPRAAGFHELLLSL
jgi:hypothetical protein